jgi:hypothetical protein
MRERVVCKAEADDGGNGKTEQSSEQQPHKLIR